MASPDATPPNENVTETVTEAAEAAAGFYVRVRDELWRSIAETFNVFSGQEVGTAAAFADLLTKLIVSTLIILIVLGLYWMLRRFLRLIIARFRLPSDVVNPLVTALRYTAILIAVLGVLSQFGVGADLLTSTAVGALLAFAFYLGWLVSSKLLARTMNARGLDRSLEQLVRNILGVVVISFGIVTVLSQFGINVISVITTLGVVGIAVGFAAQDTLANFISGITLLIERPFRIGDWVRLSGETGRVTEITLRTTRLVTRDNTMLSLPNATVSSGDIVNLSAGGPLRVKIPIGIAYKESAKAAREVMLPVLKDHAQVLKGGLRAPQIWLNDLGDSSVNLTLLYWIAPIHIATQPKISAELLEACKEALDEANIEIPFPHMQLFIDEAKGLRPVLEPLYRQETIENQIPTVEN